MRIFSFAAFGKFFTSSFCKHCFPQVIQPKIEQIPGVVIKEVVDGSYEDLVYVILEIDGEWEMRLNVENTKDFFMTGNFIIEAINECSVHDDSFIRLEDAVSHYRLDYPDCR